ncbi:Protein kinase-like domain containing protein [Lactarius tabidus]
MAGIPSMHWYGREDPYNVLILNCLGLMLEDSISKHHNISFIFSLANQMLSYIKPANFMTGAGELSNQVFLIDFGLAQLFCTIAFTSINSHSGQTQSCCDNLESLMYSIVYLCYGCLPWQDIIKEGPVEQYEAAVLDKKTTSVKTLCQGLPLPFVTFMQHIQSLGFNEKPQYDYLHTLLMQCSASDSNDVVSDLITIPPSHCKLTVPTSLPSGQWM